METNFGELVTAIEKEVAEVKTAEEALAGVRGELDTAKQAVATKQQAVDAAVASVTTERGEAIAALRALVDAATAMIEELQPSA